MAIWVSTLLTALAGGTFAVITIVLTQSLASRDAKRTRAELQRQERDAALATLYVDVISVLEIAITMGGRGDDEYMRRLFELTNRVRLLSRAALVTQFEKATAAIDAWAKEARLGEPKRIGNMIEISSHQSGHVEKAGELYDAMYVEFGALKKMFREHLEELGIART